MRGCFVLIVGIFMGVALLALAEVFVIPPPAPPLPTTAPYDVRIVLPDGYLTRAVQAAAASDPSLAPFRKTEVATQEGDIVFLSAALVAAGGGSTLPARIEVRPVVNQNRVTVQVVQASIGSLPIPTTLFLTLENQINRRLSQALGSAPYHIVAVSTTNEGVLVDLTLPK